MTDTPSAGEPTDPPTGDVVPTVTAPAHARYTFGRPLGEGGMGNVFAARDTALNREVAVKVLADRYAADSPTARRFLDEARITGQLQHPGIPPVHDLGILSDGRPFLAMKLIKGQTLDELLKDRPDPTADRGRLVGVFEAICQAVGYAHAHRVIHRDLKPANVMVGAFGEVQVMDWGLAKVLASVGASARRGPNTDTTAGTHIDSDRDADFHTRAGSVMGTPAYMPPEQAAGAVGEIDARSDVFGLGAILCVILTGQPPYLGTSAESVRVLAARGAVADAFSRLDACAAEPELVDLCKRCLSPDMAARPADAGEVATAVGSFRSAAEERARRAEVERAEATVRAAEERKRRKVLVALAAAGVLLVGVVGGGAWWAQAQAGERERERAAVAADRERRQGEAREVAKLAVEQLYAAIDAGRWVDARSSLALAEERVREVPEDDPLRPEVAQARKDYDLAKALDVLSVGATTQAEADRWPTLRDEAFAAYGLDIKSKDASAVATGVRQSRVANQIIGFLYLYLPSNFLDQPDRAYNSWLMTLLLTADADPWRRNLLHLVDVSVGLPWVAAVLFVCDPSQTHLLAGFNWLLTHVLTPDEKAEAAFLADPRLYDQPATVLRFFARLGIIASDDPEYAGKYTQLLRSAHLRHPDDYGLAMALGQHHATVKTAASAGEAVAFYRLAVGLRPQAEAAWVALGEALETAGDATAGDCFARAERLHPTSAYVQVRYGHWCLSRNDLIGAATHFTRAVELTPNDTACWVELGRVRLRQKDRSAAQKCFLTAEAVTPQFGFVPDSVGDAWAEVGDLDAALAAYLRAVRSDDWPGYHHKTWAIYTARGEYDRVVTEYLSLVCDQPNVDRQFIWPNGTLGGTASRAVAMAGRTAATDGERQTLRRLARYGVQSEFDRLLNEWRTNHPGWEKALPQKQLGDLLADPLLTSVRHPMAVAFLPADERDQWRKLWADVRKLHADTAPKPPISPR